MKQFGKITATARALPDNIITNDDLTRLMETSDEWITSRTGIKERRIAVDQSTSDLCIETAKKLLAQRNLSPERVDFILVATMSPDYTTPSVAAQVQGAIGAFNALAFDISAACSGFVYGLSLAEKMIRCGSSIGLVIGGETLSKLIDWTDRSTAVLFGDGAGGVLLEADSNQHFLKEHIQSDGKRSQSLTAGSWKNDNPFYTKESENSYYLSMDGRGIYDFALRDVSKNLQSVMDEEVSYFLLHQANRRIIEKIAKKVKQPREKFLTNMERYGNTSAASIPILLDEAVESGKILLDSKQKMVFTGYGGGLTWGSLLYQA